jgi:hypothetical protein
LASVISIWQAILHDRTSAEECFLSLSDNSSAVGWLHKASINPDKNLPLFFASRKFAKILLLSNTCIYSQHIPGVSNKIADALSQRFDMSDNSLFSFIHVLCPKMVPPSFKIYPVHPIIKCWMTSWLLKCNDMKGSLKTQRTRKVELGEEGMNMQNQLDFPMIFGSQTSYLTNKSKLSEPLPQPSVDDNFLAQTNSAWLHQQSKRPWQNWVRSLGQMWGTTPHMEME